MKTLIAICLFVSPIIHAETICPNNAQSGYHPMPESEFSTAKVLENIRVLQDYFEGKEKLDPEFIWSTQILIEGTYLRNEITLAKSNTEPEYLTKAIKRFCDFMSKKAYYVH
ncbi:MAG: hypothetical protein ACPGR2_04445 [Psychrobium sp.]